MGLRRIAVWVVAPAMVASALTACGLGQGGTEREIENPGVIERDDQGGYNQGLNNGGLDNPGTTNQYNRVPGEDAQSPMD